MGTRGDGVEARAKSIRLFFIWNEQRCRETLTVNGTPLAGDSVPLHHGDVIELAGTQMQFIQH